MNKGTLWKSPASLKVSQDPIGTWMKLGSDVSQSQPASLSPMQHTYIYAESMTEGQEMSLNYSDNEDPLDLLGTLHQQSNSMHTFSFMDVESQQSS